MILEPTYDIAQIERIVNTTWQANRLEHTPEVYTYESNVSYLLVTEDDGTELGVFMLELTYPYLLELHLAFLPSAYGYKTREAGKMLLKYIRENIIVNTIFAKCVERNRLARKLILDCGLEEVGKIPKCVRHLDGGFDNVLLFALERTMVR